VNAPEQQPAKTSVFIEVVINGMRGVPQKRINLEKSKFITHYLNPTLGLELKCYHIPASVRRTSTSRQSRKDCEEHHVLISQKGFNIIQPALLCEKATDRLCITVGCQ